MRFIKKLPLFRNQPASDKFSVLADDRIITDTKKSLQVPSGLTADRPAVTGPDYSGMIRYNTDGDVKEFEVYNYDHPANTPRWEPLRTVRPGTITIQDLGTGTYNDSIFGPLRYDIDITLPQNLSVYVENVYQIPAVNYTLISDPSVSTATITYNVNIGDTTIYLNTLTNINVGSPPWRRIAGVNINSLSTITAVSVVYNNTYDGYPVSISIPTTGGISLGTEVSVSYCPGTYVQFNEPVPEKPVITLLGLDGYWPVPFPDPPAFP